jgi:glycerol-3-phosphate acyltransferase PlsX
MKTPVCIALDAMGGDHAPREIVLGALEAAPLIEGQILLVGRGEDVRPLLGARPPSNIVLVEASQIVTMEDKPLDSYRKKKDSSLMVACQLVKDGRAQAMVSAGNTGAASATSLLLWRQIEGIHRPAIATSMPNLDGGYLLLDSGASPDVDPPHLLEFALMGRAYAMKVMGRPNPKVHLLNIGEEPGKGNAFAKEVFHLLEPFPWFAGNIEGKDIYTKPCDVVVCDAFVGNIVLKTSEGVAEFIVKLIRDSVPKNKIAQIPYLPLRGLMKGLMRKTDWAEVGGSPLLGLNGLCTICHGRSPARAIKNALLMTQRAIQGELVETIHQSVRDSGLLDTPPTPEKQPT